MRCVCVMYVYVGHLMLYCTCVINTHKPHSVGECVLISCVGSDPGRGKGRRLIVESVAWQTVHDNTDLDSVQLCGTICAGRVCVWQLTQLGMSCGSASAYPGQSTIAGLLIHLTFTLSTQHSHSFTHSHFHTLTDGTVATTTEPLKLLRGDPSN